LKIPASRSFNFKKIISGAALLTGALLRVRARAPLLRSIKQYQPRIGGEVRFCVIMKRIK